MRHSENHKLFRKSPSFPRTQEGSRRTGPAMPEGWSLTAMWEVITNNGRGNSESCLRSAGTTGAKINNGEVNQSPAVLEDLKE